MACGPWTSLSGTCRNEECLRWLSFKDRCLGQRHITTQGRTKEGPNMTNCIHHGALCPLASIYRGRYVQPWEQLPARALLLLAEKTKMHCPSHPRISFSAKPQGTGEMVTEWEGLGFRGDRKKGSSDLRCTALMLGVGPGLVPPLLGCREFYPHRFGGNPLLTFCSLPNQPCSVSFLNTREDPWSVPPSPKKVSIRRSF